ncbi:M20 metallopeptidase family protein [Natranaerobius thermophilus]|uniref:Amidohydrolase n=1 Tax=Natranaerobius thermophilus (strain ATCC BAA-1301 / DSM 18059 / JW/NM-WN-LF) TaxID=457570 RepID=B2A2X1_NATTJ|nr:M20 family metallopeptidase [Natranaerobius thermophilus]ACB86339.1 amidohydrolase [Natranaerobius thermophilus JW/NM-WN-LF]
MNQLISESTQIKDSLIQWRRDIHSYPELGMQEEKTSNLVQEKIYSMGIEPKNGVGKTGVLGLIEGENPGPTIGLRADMDALNMNDEKNVSYASEISGMAHSCGHDAHTAMLLGAAWILKNNPPKYGNVKLIFQPGEEGFFGAKKMIEDGALEEPKVDAIGGLHVNTTIPTGSIMYAESQVCAAADFIEIEIIGQGGHAAHPHLTKDPVPVAGEVLSSLQRIISRNVDPLDSGVITIGQIHGGSANNIIPESVKLGGTVRTLNPEIRNNMEARIESVVSGITQAHGLDYKFKYTYMYPSVNNADQMVDLLAKTSHDLLGKENVLVTKPSMGGEDFSFFTERVPGVFFRLGVRNEEKGITYPGHHPLFDIDEEALPIGSAIMAGLALNYLNQ